MLKIRALDVRWTTPAAEVEVTADPFASCVERPDQPAALAFVGSALTGPLRSSVVKVRAGAINPQILCAALADPRIPAPGLMIKAKQLSPTRVHIDLGIGGTFNLDQQENGAWTLSGNVDRLSRVLAHLSGEAALNVVMTRLNSVMNAGRVLQQIDAHNENQPEHLKIQAPTVKFDLKSNGYSLRGVAPVLINPANASQQQNVAKQFQLRAAASNEPTAQPLMQRGLFD